MPMPMLGCVLLSVLLFDSGDGCARVTREERRDSGTWVSDGKAGGRGSGPMGGGLGGGRSYLERWAREAMPIIAGDDADAGMEDAEMEIGDGA